MVEAEEVEEERLDWRLGNKSDSEVEEDAEIFDSAKVMAKVMDPQRWNEPWIVRF